MMGPPANWLADGRHRLSMVVPRSGRAVPVDSAAKMDLHSGLDDRSVRAALLVGPIRPASHDPGQLERGALDK